MRGKIKRIGFILLLTFFFMVHQGFAQVPEGNQYEEVVYIYEFPEISPELDLHVNYTLLDHIGSERAGEYNYLHSSAGAGVLLKAFPFPHRIHLELEAINKKDFLGDIRYAYKDIAFIRALTRGLYHNTDNKFLVDAGPSSQYTVEQRDTGKDYGTSNYISSLFLRLKTPDYPLHLFIDSQLIKRDGLIQQRFLSSYLPLNRVSMERSLDWESRSATIGTNTHLGPVEVELSHNEKRLDIEGDRLFENSYNGNIYPHNLMPELRGSTTTFKIHTSYTGQIVAAATLSRTERENKESGAKADYLIAAGDLTYMPDVNLTVFLRYRHKEIDMDNPDFIPVNYLGYSAYSSPISVRPSISSVTDTVSGTVRYRVIKGLTIYGEYTGERIKRDNSDEWKLPEETVKNTVSLSANLRPVTLFDFKVKYSHQEIDAPAYNNQPDRGDEAKMSVNLRPASWMSSLFMYSVAWQRREHVKYMDEGLVIEADGRNVKRESLFGSITFLITERLTVTPNYAYIRNRIQQDLLYNNIGTTPEYYIEKDVLYRDTSHIYGINLSYIPKEKLTSSLDIAYTLSKGVFSSGPLISEVTSIKELETEADIREAALTLRTDYELKHGWNAGIRYSFADYDDRRDDSLDGRLHLVLVSVSKRW